MGRQHYRARDKTVRKMGRDGLTEENLRSGETVRVSRREADQLTLPKTAPDSMNFQDRRSRRAGDKQAGEKHRGGYSPDFKRPDNDGAENTQTSPYQADTEKTDSYREDTGEAENCKENVPSTDTGIREADQRQIPAVSSYSPSGRNKKYIPEPLAVRYRRNGETAQQEKGFHRENIREKPGGSGETSGADTEPAKDSSRSRRKNQVYDHARKEKERKKTEEGKSDLVRREEERHTGNRLSEQKKKDSRLSFEEEGGVVRGAGMRLAGKAALKAVTLASSALADDGTDGQQEDLETEVLRDAKQAGERTLRYAIRRQSRRMQKRNRRAGEEHSEASRKRELRKFYQKQRIKKAYAEARRGEKTAEGTGRFLGKAKSIAAEVFRNKKGLLIAAASILLLFLFFSAGFSGCSAMVQGTSSTFIGTTYPSEDEDIYDAEAGYQELEEALDKQINTMETTHPGYDEYRYQVDEITHNPYQLISFLTVLYEEFTYEQIKDILPVLFAEQYRLTLEEITEIRTRTETQTVTDPLTGEETEEEVEVEYEWRILCINLTNKGFDTVARSRLTQEQTKLYDAYNLTYGNRSYLFDIAGIPSDNAGGAGYEIPEEALSDEQFARMIREAEKYLGMAYVWGGASPETGFDCSGFISWVINQSGNGWNVGRQTAEGLRQSCTYVSPSEAKPGDLIFFQGTYNTSGASHVGIYVGNGMMIHAGNPIKYSNINTPYWQGHFLAYGRI